MQTINDAYENLEVCYQTKKRKVLVGCDDMKADLEADKKSSLIVTELCLRGRNLNIFLVFISQYYFKVPKTIRLIIYLTRENSNKYNQVIRLILSLRML